MSPFWRRKTDGFECTVSYDAAHDRIEVELRGGRRVRFDRETDPETIRALVTLLEGADR